PDFCCRLRILDQLHELVLVDDFSWGHCDVFADAESLHVGHCNCKPAIAALQICKEILQTAQQVLSAGFQGCCEDLRIGGDEIGRRQGINELARVEIDPASGGVVDALDVADCRKN